MKRDYQGFEIDGQYGLSSRGDAEEYRVRGLAGFHFGDGRGNFVVSAQYNKDGRSARNRSQAEFDGRLFR